jgi:hypothetical protein
MLSRVNVVYLRISHILFLILDHKKKTKNILVSKGQHSQFLEQFPTRVSASTTKHDSNYFPLQPEDFYTVWAMSLEQ